MTYFISGKWKPVLGHILRHKARGRVTFPPQVLSSSRNVPLSGREWSRRASWQTPWSVCPQRQIFRSPVDSRVLKIPLWTHKAWCSLLGKWENGDPLKPGTLPWGSVCAHRSNAAPETLALWWYRKSPLLSAFGVPVQDDYIKMCLLNIICKWQLLIGCQGAWPRGTCLRKPLFLPGFQVILISQYAEASARILMHLWKTTAFRERSSHLYFGLMPQNAFKVCSADEIKCLSRLIAWIYSQRHPIFRGLPRLSWWLPKVLD